MILIGQFLGFLGIFVNILIYQQKDKNKILFFKLLSDIVWMTHYLFLSAFTGAATATIGIIRETVFIFAKKHRKQWLIVFLLASFISSYITFQSIYSIFPAIAGAVSVISFWQKSPINNKILSIPIAICMFIYSYSCGSISGVCNEILTIISSVVSIYLLTRRKNSMEKLRIGVINWDNQLPDNTYFGFHTAKSLSPSQFKDRVPYFAQRNFENITFNNRTLKDYDTELQYAVDAGIDYFAYVWYPKEASKNHIPSSEKDCSHKVFELRKAMEMYMKSPLNKKIGFCAILSAHPFTDNDLKEVATAMKKPFYEKINGRPLVYIFGGCRNDFVLKFKKICAECDVAEPFAVAMCNDGVADNENNDGIDALCAYAATTGNVTDYAEHINDVLDKNTNRNEAYTSIPFFSLGWNPTPRIVTPVPCIKYRDIDYAPSPIGSEIINGGKRLCEYIKQNRRAENPNHILTFAWNEFEEGGWLCPTYLENGIDDSKIKAFKTLTDHLKKEL